MFIKPATKPSAQPTDQTMPLHFSKGWRVTGWVLLALILTLGFLGYLMPSMRVNWQSIASMCGF